MSISGRKKFLRTEKKQEAIATSEIEEVYQGIAPLRKMRALDPRAMQLPRWRKQRSTSTLVHAIALFVGPQLRARQVRRQMRILRSRELTPLQGANVRGAPEAGGGGGVRRQGRALAAIEALDGEQPAAGAEEEPLRGGAGHGLPVGLLHLPVRVRPHEEVGGRQERGEVVALDRPLPCIGARAGGVGAARSALGGGSVLGLELSSNRRNEPLHELFSNVHRIRR